MNAAIIAVGSELLGTSKLDTNSLEITRLLEKYGVRLVHKSVVGDVKSAVVSALRFALEQADLIVMTGGLGPTEDDLTKDAVAEALGLQLREDAAVLKRIEELFTSRNLTMADVNRRQAMVFAGHAPIQNPRGTAPGFHLALEKAKDVWIFPGVPHELEGMVENTLEPWLREKRQHQSRFRRVVKITGMTESRVEEKLAPFYRKYESDPIGILCSHGEVQICLQADGTPDDAYPRLTAMEHELREIFQDRIFGLDDENLEGVVGRLLASRGETLATAESCTGGLLASRVTDVSGSSAYFLGGVTTYSRQSKLFLLGVDPAMIDKHGEVSEEVATQMAVGARRRFSTTYGIGVTGIAGPTGGSEKKPVGMVHAAVSAAGGGEHQMFQFRGSRQIVKYHATQMALNLLRLMIVRSN